jgi:hypothetical protein
MNILSLERRLSRVEADRSGTVGSPIYFIWYETGQNSEALGAAAIAEGRCQANDNICCVSWRSKRPLPASRWTSVHRLSDEEFLAVEDEIERWIESDAGQALLRDSSSTDESTKYSRYSDRDLTAMILARDSNILDPLG